MIPFTMLILLFSCFVAHAEIVVVVAKNSVINTLDEQYVANIFLARTNQYPNGEKVIPIEIKRSAIRTGFYQTISGKTPTQLNTYWTTLVFTGKGKPPIGLTDQNEVEQRLISRPGTITYLSADDVTDNMKVVYRFN